MQSCRLPIGFGGKEAGRGEEGGQSGRGHRSAPNPHMMQEIGRVLAGRPIVGCWVGIGQVLGRCWMIYRRFGYLKYGLSRLLVFTQSRLNPVLVMQYRGYGSFGSSSEPLVVLGETIAR